MSSVVNAIIGLLWPHSKNQYRPLLIRVQGLLVLLLSVVLINGTINYAETGRFQVLSFATNLSVNDLLNETNAERTAAGLAPLSLNSKLSSAAQSKAQHMVSNDYWAHVAPDGTTPWNFIESSGYVYLKAGENLAYGFLTSDATVEGWMNSPGHRANILETVFSEVGFGFIDGPNFQGDEYTIVVAMYGDPYQNIADESTTVATAVTVPQEPVAATTSEQPVESSDPKELEATALQVDSDSPVYSEIVIAEGGPVLAIQAKSKVITNLEALVSGRASISMYITISALMAVGLVYMLRHIRAVHSFIVAGEHLLEGHPLLEAGVVYLAIWLVLSATYGVVI